MARLVIEDSEDEFPDLVGLMKARPSTLKAKQSTSPVKRKNVREPHGKGKELEIRHGENLENKETEVMEGKETSKIMPKKKRILGRRNENPLLRPIGKDAGFPDIEPSKRSKQRNIKPASADVSLTSVDILVQVPDAVTSEAQEPESSPKGENKRTRKTKPGVPTKLDSEDEKEESGLNSGDDGLSDFVVDDSDSLEEEDSVIEMPPPRSVRRLVKGRRPAKEEDEIEKEMRKLKFLDDDDSVPFQKPLRKETEIPKRQGSETESGGSKTTSEDNFKSEGEVQVKRTTLDSSSDLDDPFTLRL